MPEKVQFRTNIIERYKNGESSREIGQSEGCSYNTVLRELKRGGVDTGWVFWTREEIEKLKEIYPNTSKKELLKEFPSRKENCIRAMARKLGIKKEKCKEICIICEEEFIVRTKHGRKFCLKCLKKRWEHDNLENGNKRKEKWLQMNPGYPGQYIRRPEVRKRMNEYQRHLRRENPKFHLDQNMCNSIGQSLKGQKAGRRWETLVSYTLRDLMKHLEEQFDDKLNWGNYGSYWHVDHIKPRSLFKYIFPTDPEFKKCWALENLQPLEKSANFRKSNTFRL